MCGIAGYFGQGNREILEKMTNSLRHRGPDDAGFFVQQNVGLGHRRLSIIDLSPTGHQPMSSADGRVTIVFNGEIYNFQSIRDELKRYPFRGKSDTEVILAAYQAYSLDCFKKMNGMFALALYDAPRERLVLARDRLGKKPLYWGKFGETVVFGSELKALLQHPAIEKEIDQLSFQKYLAFDYVPTPQTIFKNVFKLDPGHFLIYEKGEIKEQKFWELTFGNHHDLSEAEVLRELDERLEKAVSSRLVSDVPLGIFLSGGLDSSAIAYYAQKASAQRIKTFSIGFSESSFDESKYAKQAAEYLGTEHYSHVFSAKDSLEIVPKVPEIFDEPVADYSVLPTYLLSKFTREHVTVALGGDGGDELFFGYPTFQAERVCYVFMLDNPLGQFFLRMMQRLSPTSHAHFSLKFKLERLLAGIDVSFNHRHSAWLGNQLSQVASGKWQAASIYEDIDKYFEKYKNASRWQQLQALYLRTYLMDQVLVKVDRASMAASLEVRAPFLDYELVDFVTSIPYNYQLRGLQTKYLLKELMKDKLPREIVYRKKQGFGVPLAEWFTKELKPLVLDLLSEERLKRQGHLEPKAVTKIVKEHLEMKRDNRKVIWNLLVWQLWYDRWIR